MSISKVVLEHDISSELIINLDQIPFQSKKLMTSARLQPHLQSLQLGILTDATNLHRKH